jgi:hypothetical protein
MLVRPVRSSRRPECASIFASPKCPVGIPVNDVLVRHALEQASLESAVREILYRVGPRIECPAMALAGVVLRRRDGEFLLCVHEVRDERGEEESARLKFVLQRHGLQLLERDAEDIFREPLFSNVRIVWSYAGGCVSLKDRLRLSLALEKGPQRIIDLESRASPDCDLFAAVCVLACENLVRLTLQDAPLGPQTIVEI